MDIRVQALEGKCGRILAIEEKLDRVIHENDSFRKEIYLLTKENHELLKEKVEMEKENQNLKKQCEEMKLRLLEVEKRVKEGDAGGKKECLNLIDARMKEVKKENEEVQMTFREIIKKQEEERNRMGMW